MADLLRTAGPLLLAIISALLIDRVAERRGLVPPGFRVSEEPLAPDFSLFRRVAAGTVLAAVLWVGVFAPLGSIGSSAQLDPTTLSTPQLFALHGLLMLAIVVWYLLGFGVRGRHGWWTQFGGRAARPLTEIGIGLAAGVAAWMAVIAVMVGTALALWALGGRDLLPESAPPLVPWLAGLPLVVRLAISLSAGVAEEAFFRGFLQPRAGILFSTALFVLAHLSYEQPFMLLGVLLLSMIFALLVRWRQNIWAAVTAHATFDAIQLAVMIPWALEHLDGKQLPIASSIICF